jgi:hypothetical protein
LYDRRDAMYQSLADAYQAREAHGGPTGLAARKKSTHPHK